jgi:Flp pilus assembly protein TadG
MRIQLSVSRREDGAVAVLVAIFAVVLLGIVAFTTDFGMTYAQRQALATGADSAALAVVHAKYTSEISNPAQTCAQLVTNDAALGPSDPTKASTIALAQVNANAPFGATIPASAVTTTLTCVSNDQILQVTVADNRTISSIFGQMLGTSSVSISRQGVAALGVVNKVRGLEPIALCTNQAQAIIKQHLADVAVPRADSIQLVSLNKVWGSGACDGGGGAGSGNWGWLDFGAGVSVPDLVNAIDNGSGTLALNPTTPPSLAPLSGTPGNKGNSSTIDVAMNTIMSHIVTLPVYDTVGGSGATTTYNIIGFLSLKLCGYDNKDFGDCYSSLVPMTGNDLQIQYVNYTSEGQMGKGCGIGLTCAFNAYVTQLIG